MKIKRPRTKEEFEKYFDLRYRILRKPHNQPLGSEKDNIENESIHLMCTKDNKVVGVIRGHFNTKKEAQIRFLAIEKEQQGKGIGKTLLIEMEKILQDLGAKYIVLNSRATAINFYKKNGYNEFETLSPMFGCVEQVKMRKKLQ